MPQIPFKRGQWLTPRGRNTIRIPAPFRAGRGSLNPTAGGRLKIRQAINGEFVCYGSRWAGHKRFRSFAQAQAFANAVAYVANQWPISGHAKVIGDFARRAIVKELVSREEIITKSEVDGLIKEIKHEIYGMLREH